MLYEFIREIQQPERHKIAMRRIWWRDLWCPQSQATRLRAGRQGSASNRSGEPTSNDWSISHSAPLRFIQLFTIIFRTWVMCPNYGKIDIPWVDVTAEAAACADLEHPIDPRMTYEKLQAFIWEKNPHPQLSRGYEVFQRNFGDQHKSNDENNEIIYLYLSNCDDLDGIF